MSFNKNSNLNLTNLEHCDVKRISGYYKDGFCKQIKESVGTHTICVKMNKDFLTKVALNDLEYKHIQPNDNYCMCSTKWLQYYQSNVIVPPNIHYDKTHISTLNHISKHILEKFKEI